MKVRFCIVCGRKLTKTPGAIGPRCIAKLRQENGVSIKSRRMPQQKYRNLMEKYDIFPDEEAVQSESRNSKKTSKCSKRQKKRQ